MTRRSTSATARDNARTLANTEYLAREIAAIRIALEHKADREDVAEPLERLTGVLESLQDRLPEEESRAASPE